MKALPHPVAIIWDWDNTLVDGWAAIAAGLHAAFVEHGLTPWTVAEVKARVRRSLRESFPEIFGSRWEAARETFYREVRACHLQVLNPMPGAHQVLHAAAALVPQAVNSNKQGALLRAEAEMLGWAPLFTRLVGAGDAEADKPDPAPMHLGLAACKVSAGPAVWYVGDTGLDMMAARNAGCTAVLLGDAAHDGGLGNVHADAVFATADGLADYLRGLAKPGLTGQI